MEKDFFDVFPNLKIKDPLQELLDMVAVTRVSCNPDKTKIGRASCRERVFRAV